jgi:hypothetical protein
VGSHRSRGKSGPEYLGVASAHRGWPPHPLHAAVGLGPAGAAQALLGAGDLHHPADLLGAELRAVVGGDGLPLPAHGGRSGGHPAP